MRYEYIWSIVVLLLTVAPQGAFAGEKTDLTPSIAILRAEDGVLFVELTNTTDSDVMIDMARNEQGLIPCVHLLVKATNGVIITTNAVFVTDTGLPTFSSPRLFLPKSISRILLAFRLRRACSSACQLNPFLRLGGEITPMRNLCLQSSSTSQLTAQSTRQLDDSSTLSKRVTHWRERSRVKKRFDQKVSSWY